MTAEPKLPEPTMTSAPQVNTGTSSEVHDQRRLGAAISKQVIAALGLPARLHEVQVRRLWDDHYRVNVFVGLDAASARVANSYFLTVDRDGHIVTSKPEITRMY
jgi:hypothetical protein